MEELVNKINNVIKDIQEQQGYRSIELSEDIEIVDTLGFRSLDIAQLIAVLELELGVDPFSMGKSLSEMTTLKDLYYLYYTALNN